MYLDPNFSSFDEKNQSLVFSFPYAKYRITSWNDGMYVEKKMNGSWVRQNEVFDTLLFIGNGHAYNNIDVAKKEALKHYIAAIPEEIATLGKKYRESQLAIFQICSRTERGVQLLKANPNLLWLISPTLIRLNDNLHELLGKKQKELIQLHGGHSDNYLPRLIQKIEIYPSSPFYSLRRTLMCILASPEKFSILGHVKEISSDFLFQACDRKEWTERPIFKSIIKSDKSTSEKEHMLERLPRVYQKVHESGQIKASQEELNLAKKHYEPLFKLYDQWVDIEYNHRKFPEPPFAGNDNIVPITDYEQLRHEGKDQHHCVVDYIEKILNGESYIYKVYQPRATLEICPNKKGFWHIGEFRLAYNVPVSHTQRYAAEKWLESVQSSKTITIEEENDQEKKEKELTLEDLTRQITLDPNNGELYLIRGDLYYDFKQYELAIEDFTKVIEWESNNAYAYKKRGHAYFAIEDYKLAIESYLKAIELNPNDDNAYFNCGTAYYDLKDYKLAIEFLSKAIELNPDNDNAYFNCGSAYCKLKYYMLAIESYSKAIELNPNDDSAYFWRGRAYYDLKDYNLAIESYLKAIELNPNYASAYFNCGNVYYDLKDYKLAIESYSKAIELNPDNGRAYFKCGNIYYDLEDYKLAIEFFSKSIELNPNDAEIYAYRGLTYDRLKEYDAAIADYSNSIELVSDNWAYYCARADAYYSSKKYDLAIKDYTKAIQFTEDRTLHEFKRLGIIHHKFKRYEQSLIYFNEAIYCILDKKKQKDGS